MEQAELSLIAHLMRRAGFGASRAELEEYASKGYDAVVNELLHPESVPDFDEDVLKRYYPELRHLDSLPVWAGRWVYRMVNSRRPLVEKMALFWHHIFATAWHKSEHTPAMIAQIETFRDVGLSDLATILRALSRDPAMMYWLDNCENHRTQPNENYGRELLELFSMGVGSYTEDDVKTAARAFTGWTFEQPIPLYPYGHYMSSFEYRDDDHDDGVKGFLGETGQLDGDAIIEVIVGQPATSRFICRHLYNFFVADEPQVPAWPLVPPRDPEAVDTLVRSFEDSGGDMRSIMRTLLTSDFFKEARFKKVKSPAELVAGTIKLAGTHRFPELGLPELDRATTVMGQQLFNPPTVEGWHTGKEWIDGGTLNERINFAVEQVGDPGAPGVQEIVSRLTVSGGSLSPEELVDRCLDLAGPMEVAEETRRGLVGHAKAGGDLRFDGDAERERNTARVGRMLQLIVSSREYQMA